MCFRRFSNSWVRTREQAFVCFMSGALSPSVLLMHNSLCPGFRWIFASGKSCERIFLKSKHETVVYFFSFGGTFPSRLRKFRKISFRYADHITSAASCKNLNGPQRLSKSYPRTRSIVAAFLKREEATWFIEGVDCNDDRIERVEKSSVNYLDDELFIFW